MRWSWLIFIEEPRQSQIQWLAKKYKLCRTSISQMFYYFERSIMTARRRRKQAQGFYKKLKNVSCEYYHVNG